MAEVDERIEALQKRLTELASRCREIEARLKYKSMEARVLQEVIKNEAHLDPRKTRRTLQVLEFKIATEALSIASERKFMKEIKEAEKQLERDLAAEKKRRKLAYIEGDLKTGEMERSKILEEMRKLKKEVDDAIREKKIGASKKKPEKKPADAEFAEFRKPSEEGGFVSLGEIAIIKKKG